MKNNIRKKFINLLLLEINKFNKHKKDKRGCNIKYSNKLILSIIIDKFILGITWRQTKDIKTNDNDIRYNTIYYRYKQLIKNSIIINAYENLLKTYCIKIDNSCAYIDSTSIINKYGYKKYTSFNNYVMKKHRTCKLSIITSKNGIPLGVTLTNTLVHDVKLILNTLPKNILFNKLCGDKGYIANDNFKNELKTNYNIELITPYRKYKNTLKNKENTLEEKELLKGRYIVEHLNNFIKQNKQIQTRYIKKNDTFINYVYLAFIKRALEILSI